MTEAERIRRATQAQSAWEMVGPIIDGLTEEYADRLIEVAVAELNAAKRADKVTALSYAIKIANNLRDALQAIILDGDVAQREKLKADRIEQMSKPQRRLLGIAPY